MIANERTTRLAILRRYLATPAAKDCVARALYDAIGAGIAFGPRELPTPVEQDWLRGAVALPLQDAVDVALDVLTWRICLVLEQAPNDLARRFDRSHEFAELGWE
jgi:hypothetical protein